MYERSGRGTNQKSGARLRPAAHSVVIPQHRDRANRENAGGAFDGPTFSWGEAVDATAGIKDYYVYFCTNIGKYNQSSSSENCVDAGWSSD